MKWHRVWFAALALGCGSAPTPDAGFADVAPLDVASFLRQDFLHSVPFEQARRYSTDDLPTVFAVLADTSARWYWNNAVVTAGMIGDELAVDPLIAFAHSGTDTRLRGEAHST